ncbi:DsbA family protein [Tenacibaculum sp. E3R01]|uniref:DsbA family oxidoreductase n=1 Tax=Tenacibaculum sp. E3R01 TaxID=2267227 RepID=UPI000DE8841F|nr:DsbA family protein [Tenacibaculum sp. E3R01]RBW54329.1 DsbA family protein [Tenacibaculum sp. E3R01]
MNTNKTVTIDFYHDVICAWCYVLSPRIRKLAENDTNITVNHHSFALFPSKETIVRRYGSKEEGKRQIMDHWRHAAVRLDEGDQKIDTDLMESRTFDYPYSMPGLIASKAAENQGGINLHWDFFDAIQHAFFVEGKNIDANETHLEIAKKLNLNIEQFKKDVKSEETLKSVKAEITQANRIGVHSVPTVVVNGTHKVPGAQSYEELKRAIKQIVEASS